MRITVEFQTYFFSILSFWKLYGIKKFVILNNKKYAIQKKQVLYGHYKIRACFPAFWPEQKYLDLTKVNYFTVYFYCVYMLT